MSARSPRSAGGSWAASPSQVCLALPGNTSGAQVRHRDELPLQALGRVHGQDLHPPGPPVDLGRRQAVLPLVGGGQVVEQLGQAGAGGRDVGDDVGEGVQVRATLATGQGGFDVQPDGALDVGHQIGQRLAQPAPQPLQLRGQRHQPAVTLGGDTLRRAGIGQRIDQGGQVVLRGHRARPPRPATHRADRLLGNGSPGPASTRARRASASRSAAPIRHRAPVSTRSAAAPAVGSTSTRSTATRSATSGSSSSPPRPTTSTGMPCRPRAPRRCRPCRDVRRSSTAVVGGSSRRSAHAAAIALGDPGVFLQHRVEQPVPDLTGRGTGPGPQAGHPDARPRSDARTCADADVGQVEHRGRVAKARQQGQPRRRRAVGAARSRCRIAAGWTRRHRARSRWTAPGRPPRSPGVRCHRRTAVRRISRWAWPVSWYSSSRTTRNRSRSWAPIDRVCADQVCGQLHLVGEVDHPCGPLGLGEGVDQRQDPPPVGQPLDVVDQLGVQGISLALRRRGGAQPVQQRCSSSSASAAGVGEVIGQRAGDGQQLLGDLSGDRSVSRSPSHRPTTRRASCQDDVGVSTAADGSTPTSGPYSLINRPPKAW